MDLLALVNVLQFSLIEYLLIGLLQGLIEVVDKYGQFLIKADLVEVIVADFLKLILEIPPGAQLSELLQQARIAVQAALDLLLLQLQFVLEINYFSF